MHMLTRAAAVIAAACAVAFPVTAATAGAAVPRQPVLADPCGSGIYAGYTGTQENGDGQSIIVRSAKPVASADPMPGNDCFFWFAYEGGQNKIAEYAPGGVASGRVLAARPDTDTVVLQAGTGSADQQWNYNAADNGTWTNVGTGLVLSVGPDGRLILVSPPAGTVPPQEDWTFVPAS